MSFLPFVSPESLNAQRSSLFAVLLTLLLVYLPASGQTITTTTSVTDGRTPSALQAGFPAGSYLLSDFDNVNLYNGNLNFRLPLLQVGGRGSAGMTVTLALNLKSWHIKHTHKEFPDESTLDSYVPTQLGWKPYSDYGAGRLTGRHYGLQTSSNLTCRWYSKTLSRLTFSTSDGTECELRDQLTNGQPLNSTCTQGAHRGTVFVTADGAAATFVSDTAIYDNPQVNTFGPHGFNVSGFLMLKDGARYRIDNGDVTWIRDRNGNKISFTYSANSMTITDPLNRTVIVNYNVSDIAPYGLCDQIIYKGFGGAQRILRVSHTNLANALRPYSGYSIRTLGGPTGLFPETNGSSSTNHDPTVTSAVWLPDGRSYKFFYNSYGELARVELPTAGAYEYDMTPGSGVICPNGCGWPDEDREIYRRVVERRVYPAGGTGNSYEHRDVYTNIESVGSSTSTVTREQLTPTGNVVARSRHHFAGSALNSLFGGEVAHAYGAWFEGNETQTDVLATTGSVDTAPVLRRTVTTRLQRATVSWWPTHAATYGLDVTKEPSNDPRVTEIVTTLDPATSNLVSKQTFEYDDSVPFNNQNKMKEYGFGSGSPGALIRETRTTYLTSSTYTDTNVHLRDLTTQVSVFDGGGTERVRTGTEYDNYSLDSYHAGLVSRSNISGLDATFTTSFTTRGNATSSIRYLVVNGVSTGSIPAYSQYDVAGNVVKLIDARSTPSNIIATTIEYNDRYGNPDNDARANTVPTELSGFTSFALPTKIINPPGHTTYAQYDYYLGQPVNSENANGIVTAGQFNDLLDRPTQIRRAVGSGSENQTTFAYDDASRIISTSRDRDATNDNLLISKTLYDGLGRTSEVRQYEGVTNYVATQTQYDAAGRAYRTSNPFRPWQSESPVWTTQEFDALGRVISVTSPDNATVNTTHSGNSTTVTDQAGKSRKSITDALGRLITVYEDPTGLNYQTSYDYDVLDKLITVTQGTQTRTFSYDSLARLRTATNPENGIVSYEYDNNGNVVVKTDARSVSTHYEYDSLNRITRRWYNGSNLATSTTHNTPALPSGVGATYEAKFYYDTQPLPAGAPTYSRGSAIGRLVAQTYDAGSNGDYYAYDVLGRHTLKIQQTGAINYQLSAAYNLSGALTSMTYPSGHTIANTYDAAARLITFSGNLGDGTTRTYADEIIYSSFGSLTKEKFGTTTPVYNKLFYNSRGQLAEIRASTSYTGPTDTTWDRGAIVNSYSNSCTGVCSGSNMSDNNSNLLKQQIYIPGHTMRWQQYDYDSLNRLNSAREVLDGGAEQWKQQFSYDRWGNRTINTGVTYGTGINNKSFTVNTANNRLGVPGGQSGVMTYDNAGNLTNDTYTGAGNRTYDAENKITSAWGGNNQAQLYGYDANGQRIKRTVDGVVTWHVYGLGGELIAEYAASGAATNPQKEYGYRNGQLLVTAEPAPAASVNVALAANGATVTASSSFSGFAATGAINGDRKGLFVWQDGYWSTATAGFPAWLEVQFNGSKTISEIDVVTLQDNYNFPVEPTDTMTFSSAGLSGYDVQYWNNGAWVTISGGSVSGNNRVWRKFTFAPLTTTKIRVFTNASPDGYSRLTEVEAWTGPSPAPRYDLALASNGAVATASNSYNAGYGPAGAINGDRKSLNWTNGGGWNDSGPPFPDYLEVDFGAVKTVNEIHVFTLQDNYANSAEPTESMTFTLWGLTAFELEYWNGSSWVAIAGASVSGNNKIWRQFTFTPINTSKIRVKTTASVDGYSRITEVEAYGPAESSGAGSVRWLIADHLGTPRMVLDQTGSLANMKRHDYLPFGEELVAPISGRSAAQGYAGGDAVRQQFTSQERDLETGLDFFSARYYSSIQGRFTSTDVGPFTPADPQSWNRYSYVQSSPLKFVDPTGETLTFRGRRAEYLMNELAKFTGYTLKRNQKTGEIEIDSSRERNTQGTSKDLAKKLKEILDDKNVNVKIFADNYEGVYFDDFIRKQLDVADYDVIKQYSEEFAASSLGHVLEEYYQAIKQYSASPDPYPLAHKDGNVFEGKVMSNYTKQEEGTVKQVTKSATITSFVYNTVTYDVVTKSGFGEGSNTFVRVNEIKNNKP